MKRVFLAASLAATLMAGAASAATFQDFTLPSAVDGSIAGTFGNDGGIAAGVFSNTFTFTWPTGGLTSGTISSSFTSAANDLDFTSVTLNGVPFTSLIGGAGLPEFRLTSLQATLSGLQTLIVTGRSPGPAATYSGTLTFTPFAGGVPEPSSWALMIMGFGGVGALLRRRQTPVAATATA